MLRNVRRGKVEENVYSTIGLCACGSMQMGVNMNVLAKYLAELVHAQLEGRKPLPIPENITVSDIVQISGKNHMDYLLLGALIRADNIPEEYKAPLRNKIVRSVMHTSVQVMELKQIERRFEEKQIACQPMKGARMKFIYPSPEMREMSDIDILIRDDCMDKAAAELVDMGYDLIQSIKHHDIYCKKPHMVVEAHRAMYDKTVDNNQYEYFKNLSRAVQREGYSYIYDFNTEDFYIYMISHMAKHFYAMGCGIRNLLDIYIYRNKFGESMDQKYLDKELELLGLKVFTKHMEKLASIWMGEGKSTEFYDQLFTYMLDSGIYGKDENGIWNKFCEENMKNKKISRLQLKMWYWFPPLYYMSEYYPWLEERPFLLPWAWIVRGFHGIFCKKGTHKRQMIKKIDQDNIFIYQNIYREMQLRFK